MWSVHAFLGGFSLANCGHGVATCMHALLQTLASDEVPTRVLLADDHTLVRQGLRMLLEKRGIQVVAEAANGQEAVRLAKKAQPELAILDIAMPFLNGIDAARQLMESVPKAKVILLTQHCEDEYVTGALRAGVKGYVLKNQAAEDLVHAIREVCKGSVYLSPRISRAVMEAYLPENCLPRDPLSPRECQVLQLIGEGKSTKELAPLLGISLKTAEFHRNKVLGKLGLHGTASLVRYAIRRGLVQA